MNFKDPRLWFAFLLYLLLAGIALGNHEMWADELHSWNIARGSDSFLDIFRNSRYEGHPPLWYIILWCISRFTHNLAVVKLVHLVIAAAPVFFLLFFSRIPLVTRWLIPFGYYFLFEYAVLSRNYAIAILLATLICVIMRRSFRYKTGWYYLLLLLLTNTHLLGSLLAGSLHVYFLLWQRQQHRSAGIIAVHALLGILIALPALCFIMPPEGSMLSAGRSSMDALFNRAKTFMQAPLRSILPLPAWWRYNWWNTQFLIEAKEGSGFIRVLSLVVAIGLPVLAGLVLRKDRKSLAMFFTNFFFSAAIALTVLMLAAARYTGFIYIGFVLTLWLYCEEYALVGWRKMTVNILLLVHVVAGLFAVVVDIKHPFSNSYRVKELVQRVPEGRRLVCDYWTINAYSPYIDKPVYCIDLQKQASFVLFDNDLREKLQAGNRYTAGLYQLQQQRSFTELYMLSTHSPETLATLDTNLNKQYRVALVDKREGAIEKFSNLYLYQIRVN